MYMYRFAHKRWIQEKPVFRIRAVLLRIQIQILLFSSLTFKMETKEIFSPMFFAYNLPKVPFICPQSSGKVTTTYFFLFQYSNTPYALCSVADPGCLSRIPIRVFSIPDPGSASKNLSIISPKKWFLSSWKYDRGCSSRIRVPAPGPGSGS
jgi:hypothetical protein